MLEVKIELKMANLAAFTEGASALNLSKAMTEGVKAVAAELERGVKRRTPVQTGRLRNAWDVRGGGVEIQLVNNVEYAEPVEHGSKPHVIMPKTKKALAWGKGKNRIVRKKVNHPGYKGAHMAENTVKEDLDKAVKKAADAIMAVFQ